MSSTSKKHQQFASSPLGDNILIAVCVGQATVDILQQYDLSTPGQLLGVYLQNPNGFQTQMIDYGIRPALAQSIYNGLNDFCQNHIF